jgi:hypothetical protein
VSGDSPLILKHRRSHGGNNDRHQFRVLNETWEAALKYTLALEKLNSSSCPSIKSHGLRTDLDYIYYCIKRKDVNFSPCIFLLIRTTVTKQPRPEFADITARRYYDARYKHVHKDTSLKSKCITIPIAFSIWHEDMLGSRGQNLVAWSPVLLDQPWVVGISRRTP